MRMLAIALSFAARVVRRVVGIVMQSRFASCGRHVRVDPRGVFSHDTIHLGDHVFIAPGAFFSATRSFIHVGNHVMFGPNVTVLGGNHNVSEVGRYMTDVTEKRPGDDLGVTIEDDVWVGAGATLLSGVTVARGSIVAAGAVVTKSFPPYSIIGGVPARLIRPRWDDATILEHENRLHLKSRRPSAPNPSSNHPLA